MIMAQSNVAIKIKLRKKTTEELTQIVNDPSSSEAEILVAKEFLNKSGVSEITPKSIPAKKEVSKTETKPTPKKKETAIPSVNEDEDLTPEEEARLKKAEEDFDKRTKTRKTPSKSDKEMVTEKVKNNTPRETKRQNLEESVEVPGLKIGTKVSLINDTLPGEIVRIYQSSDGKEKCMVKFGDNKPVKKRVLAVTILEESVSIKKTPGKKK